MNTRKVRAKFKKFKILLDSGCISAIVMRMPINKLNPKEDDVMQWHTQAVNITTIIKVKIYLTLPELSGMKIVTWNCHVEDSAKVRYDMILGRYLLTSLLLNLKLSDHVIETYSGPLKGSTSPMVDLGTYEFKIKYKEDHTLRIVYKCLGRRNT